MKMRLLSNIRKTEIITPAHTQRACTYSVIRRTYSLLCHKVRNPARPSRTDSSDLAAERILFHSRSHCCALSSRSIHKALAEIPKCGALSSLRGRWQFRIPSRLCGQRLFCSSGNHLCASSVAADCHRPKREGELLKYTNLLRSPKQRFVLTPGLARTIRELIWPGNSLKEESATIITANEGPGFMTQELLDNGAAKVLALCRHKQFGPALEEIRTGAAVPDNFQWRHADIYQMQHIGEREIEPPVVRVEHVFQDVDQVAWEDDVPVKVIGALPQDGERKHAYVLASLILERLSMFSFGRVQLNLFMSKNCYNTLTHPPGCMKNYRALSALYQVSSDVRLLHTETTASFKLPRKKQPSTLEVKALEERLEDLYFVQITPRRDLFSKYQLEQWEAFIFVFFIRQALAKRREKLCRIIEAWAPGSADVISEFGYSKKTVTGEVTGDDLLAIFCRICKRDNFNGAWMGEEVMGWASGRPQDMNTLELSQALGSMHIT